MSEYTINQRGRTRIALALCAGALGLCLMSCNAEGDPVAPAESTITVSANPQNVVVPEGSSTDTEITATVYSKNGTRLPGQEVTFFVSPSAKLVPPADTPISTDDRGQAKCTLTVSDLSTQTVEARSGNIKATTQVVATDVLLQKIRLNIFPSVLTSCDGNQAGGFLTLTATTLDVDGNPYEGLLITFELDPNSQLTGDFNPNPQSSDDQGKAEVVWRPTSDVCKTECLPAGENCGPFFFTARDPGGQYTSDPFRVEENVTD